MNGSIKEATGIKAVLFFSAFDFFIADYFKRLWWCGLCLLRSDIGMLLSTSLETTHSTGEPDKQNKELTSFVSFICHWSHNVLEGVRYISP